MTNRAASCVEAVDHLPAGAVLVLAQITWDEYEQLLRELADRPGIRVSYDEGTLEIMSPSAEHEEYKDFILRLVQVLCDERGVTLETRGSTTWKRRDIRKGAEPDACFYVANASHVIGHRMIDLESDPPPDVVVEIDVANESLSKFSIYSALGVPEIWRYDGNRFEMHVLSGAHYARSDTSTSFPGLTPLTLEASLERSKTQGQTAALAEFRERLRRNFA